MPDTVGVVQSIVVGQKNGCLSLQPATGPVETFVLFGTDLDDASAADLIRRSMQVSLLREALVRKLSVTISHGDNSAVVDGVAVASP